MKTSQKQPILWYSLDRFQHVVLHSKFCTARTVLTSNKKAIISSGYIRLCGGQNPQNMGIILHHKCSSVPVVLCTDKGLPLKTKSLAYFCKNLPPEKTVTNHMFNWLKKHWYCKRFKEDSIVDTRRHWWDIVNLPLNETTSQDIKRSNHCRTNITEHVSQQDYLVLGHKWKTLYRFNLL